MSRSTKALAITFGVTLLVALGLGRSLLGRDVISAVIDGEVMLPVGLIALYLFRAALLLLLARLAHRFAAWGLGIADERDGRPE